MASNDSNGSYASNGNQILGDFQSPGAIEGDIFIGLLLLACFLIGGLGNTAALIYFLRESGNTVMLIVYRFIAFADVLKSLLVLPMFLSYFCGRQRMLFAGVVMCTFWSVTFSSITHFSIFLVAVMGIVRNLHNFNPNRVKNANAITVMIIVSSVGLLILNLSPAIFWDLTAEYSSRHVTCGWYTVPRNSTDDTAEHSRIHPYNFVNALLTIVPLALLIPIAISFGLNLYSLYQTRHVPSEAYDENGDELTTSSFAFAFTPAGNRRSTITIVSVSGFYLLLNTPLLFAFFLDSSDGFVDRSIGSKMDGSHSYVSNFIYILSGPLSAMADFFIFYTKISRFRKGIEEKGQKGLSKVRKV